MLGVNIDHVATLRQARGGALPEPVAAALLAQTAGADNITVHLREDRRHIHDRDVILLKQVLEIPINFEMAATAEMLSFAKEIRPAMCCIVPEKRLELTTEGGLDVVSQRDKIRQTCAELQQLHVHVSLFVNPDPLQIKAAADCGANAVELHTGAYADSKNTLLRTQHLKSLQENARYAKDLGLVVHAGHGLNYHNVKPIAQINEIEALMIGHAIVSQAIMVGFPQAVKEMMTLIARAKGKIV